MAENSVYCSQCGAVNIANARFCQKCGATVTLLGVGSAITPAAPFPAPLPVMIVQPYGGFWIRVLAQMIDGAVTSVVVIPLYFIFIAIFAAGIVHIGDNPQPEQILALILPIILIFVPLAIAIQWLYEAFTTSSSWQGTLGKRVLNLKVTDLAGNRITFGRATGRHFAKIISGMCMNVGYIIVAFTDKKQGMHDMLAGTLVMKR